MSAANQQTLQKLSTTEIAPGGILNTDQADEFIEMAMKDSALMSRVRTYPVSTEKTEIPKLGVGTRMRKGQEEGTTGGGQGSVTTDTVTIDAEKGAVYWNATKEMMEDNIEREQLAQKLLNMMASQFGTDTQDLAINGDTASADAFLQDNDGWLKLAQSDGMPTYSNEEDTTSDSTNNPTPQPVDLQTFNKAVQTIGGEYLRGGHAFIMHRSQLQQFMYDQTQRQTALGDAFLAGSAEANPFGYDVITASNWPIDKAMFTEPRNLIYSPYREVEIEVMEESDEIMAKDLYAKYAIRVRDDFQIEEPDAGVLITDLKDPLAG